MRIESDVRTEGQSLDVLRQTAAASMNEVRQSIRLFWNRWRAMSRSPSWFLAALIVITCVDYAFVQVLLHRSPIRMDEFYAADRGLRTLSGRWEGPAEVFLSPYLEGLFVLPGAGAWDRMLWGRSILAAINGVLLVLAGWTLGRRTSPGAVLLVLPVLLCMQGFTAGMVEFRIELAVGWLGVFVLLLVLGGRLGIAGAVAGFAALLQPHGVFHFLAGVLALGTRAAFATRGPKGWWGLCVYVGGAAAVWGIWVLAFSLVNGAAADLTATFGSLVAMVTPRGSASWLHHHFWMQSVWDDLAFWVLTLVALWHFENERRRRPTEQVPWLLVSQVFFLLGLGLLRADGEPHWILSVVPVAFAAQVFLIHAYRKSSDPITTPGLTWPAVAFLVVFGLALPLRGTVKNLESFDAGRQRHSVELADWLLRDGGTYFAGVPMVITRRPAIDRYANLGAKERAELAALSEADQNELIEEFRSARLAVIVESDRTKKLPSLVEAYFRDHFVSVTGNVRLYAPTIDGSDTDFFVAFQGHYELDAVGPVTIDGSVFGPDDRVYLTEGTHEVAFGEARAGSFRLRLSPPGLASRLHRAYRKEGPMFPGHAR